MNEKRRMTPAQPSVWARFICKDELGQPYIYKSRVVFWERSNEGVTLGFVIATQTGRPQAAESFPNFERYEYPRGSEKYVTAELTHA